MVGPAFILAALALTLTAGIWLGTRMERARVASDALIAAFFDDEAINDAADMAETGDWR